MAKSSAKAKAGAKQKKAWEQEMLKEAAAKEAAAKEAAAKEAEAEVKKSKAKAKAKSRAAKSKASPKKPQPKNAPSPKAKTKKSEKKRPHEEKDDKEDEEKQNNGEVKEIKRRRVRKPKESKKAPAELPADEDNDMGEQEGGETGQEVEEPKQEVEHMEVEPAPEVAASEVPGSKVVEETAPDTPSAVDSLHTLLQGQEQMLAQTLLEGLTQRANSQTESQLFASFLVINFASCNMFVQLFVGQFVLPSFQGWALLQAKLPLTRLPKIWQRYCWTVWLKWPKKPMVVCLHLQLLQRHLPQQKLHQLQLQRHLPQQNLHQLQLHRHLPHQNLLLWLNRLFGRLCLIWMVSLWRKTSRLPPRSQVNQLNLANKNSKE